MAVRVDVSELERLGRGLSAAPDWVPQFVHQNLIGLGRRVSYLMRAQLRPHRYTGVLEESVTSTYEPGPMRLTVGPTAKRGGKWDAGSLLQFGTGPIPNLPFEPIRRWAEFKGLPAGPVWYKIKTEGVDPHPFVGETLARGDVQVAIRHTARRVGLTLVAKARSFTGRATVELGSTEVNE